MNLNYHTSLGRIKTVDSEAVLKAMKKTLVNNIRKVLGKFDIS